MKPSYLIIGGTQQGKSSICQSVFLEEDIKVGEDNEGKSVTTEPKVFRSRGIRIQLIDTVGFEDTYDSNGQIEGSLIRSLYYCKQQLIINLRGIIITISFRFQNFEKLRSLLCNLQIFFKLNNFDSIIFCLTKGNQYDGQYKRVYFEQLKQRLINEFDISEDRIIEFKTNYKEPTGQLISFKNERNQFLKNLDNLSNSIIKVNMNQYIIELQVKALHAGGRHKILRSSEQFTPNDFIMLSELYSISNLKIYQSSKGYQKTSEDQKLDNNKKILVQSNFFQTTNILFRFKISKLDFPYSDIPIGKFASIFTDKFRKEIIYFTDKVRTDKISLIRNKIFDFIRKYSIQLSDSSIVQCLFLQHLLKQNNLNDLQLNEEFQLFKRDRSVLIKANLYYNWLVGLISRNKFQKAIEVLVQKQQEEQLLLISVGELKAWGEQYSQEQEELDELEAQVQSEGNSNQFQNNYEEDQSSNFLASTQINNNSVSQFIAVGILNENFDPSFE